LDGQTLFPRFFGECSLQTLLALKFLFWRFAHLHPYSNQEPEMTTPFELPAELTIYSAQETRDAMLAWVTEQSVQSKSYLEVSARQVGEVDGSGLQLLASLTNMGLTWHLVDASTAFMEACQTMGLAGWLDQRYLKADAAGATA
jgi:ABC-type transporter Mla MlaB component